MYTFSSKLKNLSIILGFRALGMGMVLTAPKDIQVEMILAAESHVDMVRLNMMLLPMALKRMTWSKSHNEVVATQGTTTTTTTLPLSS
jgi:hypothetical protein